MLLVVASAAIVNVGNSSWQATGKPQSIAGSQVKVITIESRRASGITALGRGLRTTARGVVDQLPATNAFWVAVNERVKQRASEQVEGFCPGQSLHAIRRSFSRQSDENHHYLTTEWEVQLATPEVVSIVHTTTDYTGGFHNGIEIGVLNVMRTEAGWRELTLAELFKPELPWQQELATLLTRQLNQLRQERLEDMEDIELVEITDSQIEGALFSFTAAGLQFWYAPYSIGSWAEGTYAPLIPQTAFVGFLRSGDQVPIIW